MDVKKCDRCGKIIDTQLKWDGEDNEDNVKKYALRKKYHPYDGRVAFIKIDNEMDLCDDCQFKFDSMIDAWLKAGAPEKNILLNFNVDSHTAGKNHTPGDCWECPYGSFACFFNKKGCYYDHI